MANKAFEIQESKLRIGGVVLEAGTTGVVIPGITQASTYFVEEVDERDGNNPNTFGSDANAVTVIDNSRYLVLSGTTPSTSYVAATYSVDELDGQIEEINVETDGVFESSDKTRAEASDMWATTVSNPFVSFNSGDWTQIPYCPKIRAGEITNIGGGASSLADLDDVQLEDPSNGQVLTWNNSQEKWENQTPASGADGEDGADGVGVPAGGTTGQVLAKINGTDYNTEWVTLTGGSDSGDPAYKGFKAHYGRMWGNTDDPNGPINKIVIYKDTVTPSSTIDASTNNDTFTVTGLTGSDVVVMLVTIGEDVNQTTTAELKTFAESIIDNVILAGGVEGNINTAADMKIAFYDNFAAFSATLTDLKANFQFFGGTNSPQYTINNFTYNGSTGAGANFSILQYSFANSRFEIGSWSNGTGYVVGDTFTILGTDIVDVATGLTLASPDNDTTITVDIIAAGGYLDTFTITSGIPVPADPGPDWPSNYIGDGGDDEYDTGNYITTNLEAEISYNNGNVVSGSNAFGGGDYVVTYQNSIFGIFAVNSVADSIATQGNSGFDGNGQADTGSLYGADGGVSIGNFVFSGSTMTSPDDDLYIKAVDDLWLDALADDVHIRANDDVRIKVGYNFDDDDAQHEWRFANGGYINFPDGSEQSTAWTGNVDWDDVNNRPSIPADVSDLTDTTNLLSANVSSLVNGVHTLSLGASGNLTLPQGTILSETANTTVITPPGALAGQSLVIRLTGATGIISDHPSGFADGDTITLTVTPDYNYAQVTGTVDYTFTGCTSVELGRALTGTLTFTAESAKPISWTIPVSSTMTTFTITLSNASGFDISTIAPLTLTKTGSSEDHHIHLIAGDPSITDIYLGDDDQYVKIEKNGGNVIIGTNSNTNHWAFGTDGTTTFPGSVVNSTVAKTGGSGGTQTAIDLTKTVNKLTDGNYTLADGVEGQIMYLVRQTGTAFNAVIVIVANARISGSLNTAIEHYPFQYASNSIDIDTLIFTDGAWQASNGSWD